MDPSADRFLEWLLEKYPESDERMTSELQTLKRKLKELNESDDDDLVQELERVENKKPKFEYSCDICGQQFRQKYNKNQHMKSHFATFLCGKCGKSFSRDNTRKTHEKKCMKHSASNYNTKFVCKHCGLPFETYELLFQHVVDNHPLNGQQGGEAKSVRKNDDEQGNDQNSTKIKVNKFARYVRKGAINDNVNQTIIFPEREEKYDMLGFFAETKIEVQHELKVRREKIRDIKWYLNVRVEMERNIDDGRKEKVTPHFPSKAYTSLENDDNEHNLNDAFQKMNASLEEFIHKGSNWVVKKIIGLEVNSLKYSPIAGSSYVELPNKFRPSHSVINIRNIDQKCFLWSGLAALHPVQDHPNNVSNYKKYEHSLNLSGIDFPVSLSHVGKFEKQNDLSINVFWM